MYRIAPFCFLLSLLFWSGCETENSPPEDLLPEETYIDMLVELQLIKSYQMATDEDSVRVDVDSLEQVVFQKYGATQRQFRTSHEFYQDQIEQQKERVTEAIDRLRMETTRLKEIELDSLNK